MAYRPQLKLCGVTSQADARLVSQSGADYCGIVVNVGFSERSLTVAQAREVARSSTVKVVILFCDPPEGMLEEAVREIEPHAVQLLGRESPDMIRTLKPRLGCAIWKTLHVPAVPGQAAPADYVAAGVDAFLLDSSSSREGFLRLGGTGQVVDWGEAAALVRSIPRPVFLAGGINPENVGPALLAVRPHGIDLCSGVERSRGVKEPEKIRRLVESFSATVKKIEESEG